MLFSIISTEKQFYKTEIEEKNNKTTYLQSVRFFVSYTTYSLLALDKQVQVILRY